MVWKSSTRALLSSAVLQQHRLLVKEKAENEWGCTRKMCTPIFSRSIYKYMGSSFYWSFIKPDCSFSWFQHAAILNSEIKGSCQTFSGRSSFESIWCGKAKLGCINLIMAINSWLCSSRRCWCAASHELDHGRKKTPAGYGQSGQICEMEHKTLNTTRTT